MLVYKGHVTSGVAKNTVTMLEATGKNLFRILPTGNKSVVWADSNRVCVVEHMPNILQSLRQPVFKGFRDDILPEEVQDSRKNI